MKVTIKDKRGRVKTMASAYAKILVKLGRAQYLTRDMMAAPPSFPDSEPAAAPVLTEELDATGARWDETVHSSTRLTNADGTWRKRPGAKASV